MNLFEVRKVKDGDIENGLLDVFIQGYRYHQHGRPDVFLNLSDNELSKDLDRTLENMQVIVILDDNMVVGYLAYKIKKGHTKKLDVDQLVIKDAYRSMGLGKQLMDEANDIGLKNGCDRIELNCWMFNENAINMYEHIGFKRQRIMYEKKLK